MDRGEWPEAAGRLELALAMIDEHRMHDYACCLGVTHHSVWPVDKHQAGTPFGPDQPSIAGRGGGYLGDQRAEELLIGGKPSHQGGYRLFPSAVAFLEAGRARTATKSRTARG